MSLLQVNHLVKSYKNNKVVSGVSLSVNSGEVVGLLGPNGAGKTTSFYMIVGLIKADEGEILLDKTDLSSLSMHERAHLGIGYLPQEASVFRKLTVSENIEAVLELREDLTQEMRQNLRDKLLAEFHITAIRNHISLSLSGGERRRVEIARALAMEPKFILLDEPFAGIDPISVIDLKRIINHLKSKEIGILITDHNVRETLDICDSAYIVNEGKILARGNATEILSNQLVRKVYLGDEFDL
jgi:lipopolysaccharide export system ATP-binding protein